MLGHIEQIRMRQVREDDHGHLRALPVRNQFERHGYPDLGHIEIEHNAIDRAGPAEFEAGDGAGRFQYRIILRGPSQRIEPILEVLWLVVDDQNGRGCRRLCK